MSEMKSDKNDDEFNLEFSKRLDAVMSSLDQLKDAVARSDGSRVFPPLTETQRIALHEVRKRIQYQLESLEDVQTDIILADDQVIEEG